MLSQHSSTKVRPEHLDRPALIYVRQSSPIQVRDHTFSVEFLDPGLQAFSFTFG